MNLDNLLWKALRWWITSNYVIHLPTLYARYKNWAYSDILTELQNTNVSDWDSEIITLFLKCYIHIYNEEDPVIKDLLVLAFLKMNSIHFSWLWIFHIDFPVKDIIPVFLQNAIIEDWHNCISITEWNFSFLFENVERFKKDFSIENTTRDNLGLFILSCFELYDMKEENYPLFKWLFNIHFKPHH